MNDDMREQLGIFSKNIKESLDLYVNERIRPGGFLICVLENDLMGALARADVHNKRDLKQICQYVYMELPSTCWGNPEKVHNWLNPQNEES